jgi:hypothetical protein
MLATTPTGSGVFVYYLFVGGFDPGFFGMTHLYSVVTKGLGRGGGGTDGDGTTAGAGGFGGSTLLGSGAAGLLSSAKANLLKGKRSE